MALNNNAITTLDNTKNFLRIETDADDALLESLINRATAMIEGLYCNRPIINIASSSTITLQSQTEYFDSNGETDTLILKYYPIGTITSIYDDPDRTYTDTGDLVPSTDYVVYEDEGRIKYDGCFSEGNHSVRVIYTGGYTTATLPVDLEQACIELVGLLYKQKDTIGISGKSFSDGSISYYENRLSWSSKDILASYRKWNV